METADYAAALDLGGTKIAAAVVDTSGGIISQVRQPTNAAEGRDAVLERMKASLREALDQADAPSGHLLGIGMGVPGEVNKKGITPSGFINLPGWEGFALKEYFQEIFDCTVTVDNDANAAALGENLFGAGKGSREMLYITISTGIGGGIISGGVLVHGSNGAAGEIGHMVLLPGGPPCRCGNSGCWEAISSGTAIALEMRRRLEDGGTSIAEKLAAGGLLQAEHVFRAAGQGDVLAQEIIERALYFSGMAVANLVNVLNPQKVVIGGGVAETGEMLFRPLSAKVAELAFGSGKQVEILPAALGTAAGIVGAASLIFHERTS